MFSEAENNTMQKTPTLTRHQQETRNFQFNSVLWCQAPPTRPSFKLVFGKHMLGWTSFFLTTNLCMRFLHHGSSIAFVPFHFSCPSLFFFRYCTEAQCTHTRPFARLCIACLRMYAQTFHVCVFETKVCKCTWPIILQLNKNTFLSKNDNLLQLNKNTFVSKTAPLTPSQFFPCLPASFFLHWLRPLPDKTRMDEHPSLRCLQQSCNPLLALNINPECMPGYTLSLVGW